MSKVQDYKNETHDNKSNQPIRYIQKICFELFATKNSISKFDCYDKSKPQHNSKFDSRCDRCHSGCRHSPTECICHDKSCDVCWDIHFYLCHCIHFHFAHLHLIELHPHFSK